MRDSSTWNGTEPGASAAAALAGLETLRTAAGWMPLAATGWIAVTGDDRVRWLNGMVTNSVQALAPGAGAYTFFLSAQGRIQGDAIVWAEADRVLLETDTAQVQPLLDLLDRFIIMDDVELKQLQFHGVALAGPAAAAVLQGQGLPVPANDQQCASHDGCMVLRTDSLVVPRYEVWFDSGTAADAFTALLASEAETLPESFELLRVLEERPLYGTDIKDRDLPQETAQTRALHFAKGCYLGQEIVERIRSRGQVHRTFAGFVLHGEPPAAGTELTADGKPVGMLTTVATAPIDGEWLALGFVRREAIERGTPLLYPGGTVEARGRSGAS